MRIPLPFFALLLAGCQSHPAPVPPPPLPLADPLPKPDARLAARISHYTLGAYVDPDNDLIRHEAHAIQRVEEEARWDLRPATVRGIPELTPLVAPSNQAIAAADTVPSAEERAGSSVPTETIPASTIEQVAIAASAPEVALPPAPPAPGKPVVELEPAIAPNADGWIDLTAIAAASNEEANPFSVRTLGAEMTREVTLHVGGIIHGAVPCVLLNGRTVQEREIVEGLMLIRVEPDSALFGHGEHRIRIPVADKPTRVRVAL